MTDNAIDTLKARDEELRRERERLAAQRKPNAQRVSTVAYLEQHRPKRLLTDAEAKARDEVRGQRTAREERFERLRASGIASHLGRDRSGMADVTRIVRGELQAREALALVQGWARPERVQRWLIVAGRTGVGKSVAAGWLIARDGGRYVTIDELAQLHSSLERGLAPQTHDEVLGRLRKLVEARVLVVDELGKETRPRAPVVASALHWLVEARQAVPQADRWTLVMSNLDSSVLRERFRTGWYDTRTESRLRPLLWRRKDGGGIWELADARDGRGEPI